MFYKETDIKREKDKKNKEDIGYRDDFWKDYARILHSPSFRRLTGKTQLFPGIESDFYRNRLTHSLEVAQIGKSITNRINFLLRQKYLSEDTSQLNNSFSYINSDLVELACLAHDLGHPPFGHQGEEALNEVMKQYGGFEGNAQTIRIITRLEKREQPEVNESTRFRHLLFDNKEDQRVGCNLTYRSIASILKYDQLINIDESRENLLKGYYKTEKSIIDRVKKNVLGDYKLQKGEKFKTIECQIMDLADDIAYSIYDMEDAFKAGFFHPAELYSISSNDEVITKIVSKIKNKGNIEGKNFLKNVDNKKLKKIINEIFDIDESFSNIKVEESLANLKKKGDSFETKFKRSISVAKDGYFRIKFTSKLAHEFIESVEDVILNKDCPPLSKVVINPNIELKIEVLKHLTYEYQIKSPKLKAVEFKGKNIVRSIFIELTNPGGEQYLPQDFRDLYEQSKGLDIYFTKRVICDFVACMTDAYAIEFYNRLFSASSVSIHRPYN